MAVVRCALTVVRLLAARRLHLHRGRVGARFRIPDGRTFTVYRETSCDGHQPADVSEVTLAVWFHLRGTSSRSRRRAWLFERESILNTVLYAGFPGYRRKLWMVDRTSGDYAGLYAWAGVSSARRYAEYITGILRPISAPGSVGSAIVTTPLATYLGDDEDRAPAVAGTLDPSGSPASGRTLAW